MLGLPAPFLLVKKNVGGKMRRLWSVTFLFLLYYFSNSGIILPQELKIAVFDIQRIIRESKTIDAYRKELLRNVDEKRKILKEKEEALRQIEKKLREEGGRLSLYERRALEDKFMDGAKELRRLREDIDIELQKMDRELTHKAFSDIAGVIKKIAEKEGYTLILERNAAGVAYAKEKIDITGKILEMLK